MQLICPGGNHKKHKWKHGESDMGARKQELASWTLQAVLSHGAYTKKDTAHNSV